MRRHRIRFLCFYLQFLITARHSNLSLLTSHTGIKYRVSPTPIIRGVLHQPLAIMAYHHFCTGVPHLTGYPLDANPRREQLACIGVPKLRWPR